MSLVEVEGDLLEAKEKYIVHQTNCRSSTGRGLAKAMFTKFPFANCYANRPKTWKKRHAQPGTIDIRRGSKKIIVNLFGQDVPGKLEWKPYVYGKLTRDETQKIRGKWFLEGLRALTDIVKESSVAFPHQIGCGLAGGNWKHYRKHIENFAKQTGVDVTIYRLPTSSSSSSSSNSESGTTSKVTKKRTLESFWKKNTTTTKHSKKRRKDDDDDDNEVIVID